MALDIATLNNRIDGLLATPLPPGDIPGIYAAVSEALQGTLTLARTLYGSDEVPQVQTLMNAARRAREERQAVAFAFLETVWPVVQGTLRAMKAELGAGLVGSIERRVTGEVIADMLALAKEALAEGSEGAQNVSAVLVAAAFEDTIRKMGGTLAGVQGRPALADVLTALKTSGVLTGATLTTALGYLRFRNDALHADWARLDQAVVASCIAFTERLVLDYLS